MNNCNFYTWKEFQASLGVTAQICLLKTKHTNQLKKKMKQKEKAASNILQIDFSNIHTCVHTERVCNICVVRIHVMIMHMLCI